MGRTARSIGVCGALIAIVLVVFAPVRHHEFLFFDDPLLVTQRPEVLRGLTWENVGWAFTNGWGCNWHPITWLSHMLDVQLFGLDAGGHHLTSVLLHGANTVLLFGVLQSMTGLVAPSAFVAALFAAHPLHVESVAWVAERKDVLSAFFWILTLWAYVGYARRPAPARYLAVLGLFALGLASKPMVVTLPFVLLLLDVWPLGRTALGLRLVWEKLPLFALSAALSVVTVAFQQGCRAVTDLDSLPLALRLENALVSYVVYVAKTFWPVRLAAFYPYPQSFPAWRVGGAAAVLVGISLLAVALRRSRYVLVGWLWFVGTLVPVIGIVHAGNRQALADRFTYIPLVGLLLVVAWGIPDLLRRWPRRRLVLPIGAVLVVAACMVAARAQVGYWRNEATVWVHALDVTTGNDLAHNNLGMTLMMEGKVDEARAHFAEAVRIRPDNAVAHVNLGWTLAAGGDPDAARAEYVEALRIDPEQPDAHFNLGIALGKVGSEEALFHLEKAVRLRPDRALYHRVLGRMLAERGRRADAIVRYQEALRLDPEDERARGALAELTNER